MTKTETILAVEKVTKTFGKGASLTKAVDNLSFKVKRVSFLLLWVPLDLVRVLL